MAATRGLLWKTVCDNLFYRGVGMRSFVFLSAMLGVFVFLTVQYSFLVATGVMQFGGMLAITVIAFAVRSKQPAT